MSQVNLLPPEILASQRQRRLAGVVALAGVGVIGLIFVFYVLQLGNLGAVRSDIEQQEQTNQGLQREIETLREFEELRARAQAKQELLDAVFANEISFSGLLMDVSRVIPSTAALTAMSAAAQEPTASVGGDTTFTGRIDVAGLGPGLRHGRLLAHATRTGARLGQPMGELDRGSGERADHLHLGSRPDRGRGHGAGTPKQGEWSPMQGRRAVIVAGAGAAILGLLLVFFLVLPKMNEVAQAREELEDTRAQQQTLSAQLNALEQARDEAPENEAAIREVDGKVPPTADLPGAILFLRNAASVSGVTVLSLTPATPATSETASFSSISISASGEGSYFALVKYLHEIETLPRAATVQSMDLSPIEGSALSFAATITLYTSDVSSGPGSEPGPTEQGAIPEA